MFKKQMIEKLTRIFGIEKVTFDMPSDDQEQECLFVGIDRAPSKVTKGTMVGRVEGTITIFANGAKCPHGFMDARIQKADPNDTAGFFFYNREQSSKTFGNIVERSCSFVYLHSAQYDPAAGSLTSVNTTFES